MLIKHQNIPELSLVIPVYGCAGCLNELISSIHEHLNNQSFTYEIILIDDASKDGAWKILESLSEAHSNIRIIKLSRNFGQHAAIRAGLDTCKGNFAIVMDCDMQDPPNEIMTLYRTIKTGYDIVYSKRIDKKHSYFRKMASSIYFLIISKLNNQKIDPSVGSFSIISRKAINSFLLFKEKDIHYLFILRWLGFTSCTITHNHNPRFCGESSYSFSKLIRHAFSGLFFQTTVLLRYTVFLGFLMAFIGFSLSIQYMYRYLYYSVSPGWTSVISAILLVGGMTIICVGIIGLYIGKIFDHVKNRPLYIIDQEKGN